MRNQDILENQAKIVYLGIGSNLGNRKKNIEKAKSLLNINNLKLLNSSSYYETLSWPNVKFPKFLNIVIKIKTHLSLVDLFNFIKSIEKKIGRKEQPKNHPRLCDIDILDYDQEIYTLKKDLIEITVPHPRMNRRNFVLIPLFEINKNWYHPKLRLNIVNLLLKLNNVNLSSIKFF